LRFDTLLYTDVRTPTAGKKYSGKFQLRLGSELHQALAIRAMQTGDSLNNFCVKSLKKSL
jgi:predicted HicB family RNase H-like nuclease